MLVLLSLQLKSEQDVRAVSGKYSEFTLSEDRCRFFPHRLIIIHWVLTLGRDALARQN